MPDQITLEDRVTRFARPVRVLATGYRSLPNGDADSLMAAVFSEIEETILPRRIKVVTDTKKTVHLHVANRRLLRLGATNAQDEIKGISGTDAVALVGALQGFFSGATKVALSCTRSEADSSHSNPGCAAGALAAAAVVNLAARRDHDPVQDLFAALSDCMIAWVAIDPSGNLLKQGGEQALCRRIENLASNGLTDIDAQMVRSLSTPEQPGCILLNSGNEDGSLLVYARSQSSGFLAVVPSSAMAMIQKTWQEFF